MMSLHGILETNVVVSPPKYVKSASKWCSWIRLDEIFQMIYKVLHFGKIFKNTYDVIMHMMPYSNSLSLGYI